MNKKNVAVFASGGGSNTIAIYNHFKDHPYFNVSLIISNNADAGILTNPLVDHLPKHILNRKSFYKSTGILNFLEDHKIDFLVLAGFLWLVPSYLVSAYEGRIVNIHPALLPKYGGKGMYGMNVHKAVFNNGDKESGMTIHYVNEKYDDGAIIFQGRCAIEDCNSPKDIAARVLKLEHRYYPVVIEQLLKEL